jgi:integrin alpha FG-GAP repeat containing protein 1
MCHLATQHSSAFIDVDGDCLPGEFCLILSSSADSLDLVLHCQRPKSTAQFVQIWLNKGKEGYGLARTYDLPKGAGALSFADMSELIRLNNITY